MSTNPKKHWPETENGKGGRRLAIMKAALKLFAAKGVAETSVPAIASAANVAVGTLYCHFNSKDALANYLVKETCETFSRHLWDGFPHDAGFRQQFGFFWRRYISFALSQPDAFAFIQGRARDLGLDKASKKALAIVAETENWILDRGIASGELEPMPIPALGAMVHGAAKALVQAHRDSAIKLDDILISQTECCCWKAVRNKEQE